uniref:Cytochrome b-c1 complex subunit 6-like n=1 Tax=Rhizophora mucronata TaxID=61149 RepID=A0A2P2JPI5_RHIMU
MRIKTSLLAAQSPIVNRTQSQALLTKRIASTFVDGQFLIFDPHIAGSSFQIPSSLLFLVKSFL